MNQFPEVVAHYNAYLSGKDLIGMTAEVTLASMQAMTTTVSGTGVMGEYDASVPGQFGEIEQVVPFRMLYGDAYKLLAVGSVVDLTLRGAAQLTDGSGNRDYRGMRIVMRGRSKKLELGKFKVGSTMDASVTLSLTYLLVEADGKTMFELDKLNMKYIIDGVDQLATIRKLC